MRNHVRIARELARIARELVSMTIIPRRISFDDDTAIISSFLRHQKLGQATEHVEQDNLIVTFENGYGLIATALNKEHADEELIPSYTARKLPGSTATVSQDGYAYFDNDDGVMEFDRLDDALDYLFMED